MDDRGRRRSVDDQPDHFGPGVVPHDRTRLRIAVRQQLPAMAAECPDHTACLHLVSSAGRSLQEGKDWTGLGGRFRRFPFGVYKVGLIASRAEAIEVPDLQEDTTWLADPAWARRERIRGFAGQPLLHRGQVLGVLGVFLRARLDGELLVWLRMIADHAAAAIANARAFEEIERLRTRIEQENVYLRDEVKAAYSFGDIVGTSPALRAVLEQVDPVGPSNKRARNRQRLDLAADLGESPAADLEGRGAATSDPHVT
jgi:transcriptional regulator with GAF, ATPase, and Fis domain